MTKEEITKLLALAKATYHYTKIDDAKLTIAVWEMTLGEFSYEAVAKAFRLHFETSKFFPTPSDIRDKIVRAQIVYLESPIETQRLETGNDTYLDEFLENICTSMVNLDNEMEENK